MPIASGEMVAAVVRGGERLVTFGDSPRSASWLKDDPWKLVDVKDRHANLIYSFSSRNWSLGAKRPHAGDHHSAETVDGHLIVYGGFKEGSPGTVQIWDAASDT